MKKYLLLATLGLALSFNACANNNVNKAKQQEILKAKQKQEQQLKDEEKRLLKTDTNYAKNHITKSLKENYDRPMQNPLFQNPKFAIVTIMPYMSADDTYHEFERIWVKITNGNFVLSQHKIKKSKK
ncbi:TraV family lipoprotein [Campylobacter sp. MG1]|uniref:TraV family lipoprotein n=1 Tax=Campylobacter sp. MG1 TaxID=2976332 RepID=UPI00226CB27A|nr:TraV family lipoprotein [Campylobacter sp. MG1]